MTIITSNEALAALCATLHHENFITVDTEFLRDKTYYPQLCLIQIATEQEGYAIDALAPGIDLTVLGEVFANQQVIKVFHSARQDIEILLGLFGAVPTPLFDTQVAAMVCGFGESASYETLVSKLVGAAIDKSCRFTDWSQRPLSEKQYQYALSDVTYLRVVYKRLIEMLGATGRAEWLAEEMAKLISPATYHLSPEDAWKKIKMRSSSEHFIGLVKVLATWRELKARQMNLPRNHLLKEASLLEIAAAVPISVAELRRMRGLGGFANNEALAMEVITVVTEYMQLPKKQAAPKEPFKQGFPTNTPLVDLLKVLLKTQCEQHNIAEKMVAGSDDLLALAHATADTIDQLPVMQGWRYDIFGKLALDLKAGKIALSADHDKITLVAMDTK